MAKYRVYLKDGKGVFIAEATSIEVDDCYYNLFDNGEHIALFDKASVLAIINTDRAERVDINDGITLKSDDVKEFVDGVFGKGVLPC